MIFGERIEQARELHGWTQTELARRVGVDQSTIAYIEGGRKRPSDAVADAIAFQTGFPPSFFRQEPCPYFPFGSLEFRARASMTGRERRQAYQYAKTVFEVAARMAARLKTPPVRLSRLKCSPPEAARITRSELGLSPDTPIRHLVHELERAGVVVLALPVRLEGRDGFSGWAGGEHPVPVINLPAGAPGDRLRFSVGHEVGELVLPAPAEGVDREKAAHHFAAELLLPEAAMRRELVPPITLLTLAELKPRWRVSMQAILTRARDLEIITPRQYRHLYEQLGMRGWRIQEPNNLDIPVEKPRALRKMAEVLYGTPINYRQLASDVHLRPQFMQQLIEAHADRSELPPKPEPEPTSIPSNVVSFTPNGNNDTAGV